MICICLLNLEYQLVCNFHHFCTLSLRNTIESANFTNQNINVCLISSKMLMKMSVGLVIILYWVRLPEEIGPSCNSLRQDKICSREIKTTYCLRTAVHCWYLLWDPVTGHMGRPQNSVREGSNQTVESSSLPWGESNTGTGIQKRYLRSLVSFFNNLKYSIPFHSIPLE